MTTKLKKSTYNAIILFCLSIVSNLIIDYQAHGYPPSVDVLYASLLFALFAFFTTLSTHGYIERKRKRNTRVLYQTVDPAKSDKEQMIDKALSDAKKERCLNSYATPEMIDTNFEAPELCIINKNDDWIPGSVI
jgi:hypothetical protein